jgi:Uma2 family endonuclease
MNTLEEIQQAIQFLRVSDREELLSWLTDITHRLRPVPGHGYLVAEAVPPLYADDPKRLRMSFEEYLEFEEKTPIKHEYVGGELFAMSGATLRHNSISLNLASAFHAHLRGGPCKAMMEGMKVLFCVNEEKTVYYPDVMVCCGPRDPEAAFVTDPALVIEVLSPSTQRTDRREKALNYRHIPSLGEIALVSQERTEVTLYRREDGWNAEVLTDPQATVEFRSIKLTLPLQTLYD